MHRTGKEHHRRCGTGTLTTTARLCEDCAEEVRRLEKVADELTAMGGCEERQAMVDRAETTGGLVNRLRAHDMSPCNACTALRRRAAMAGETATAQSLADTGKVA